MAIEQCTCFPMAALRASLEIFAEAGVQNLIKRKLMNDFLRFIIGDIISKTNSEKYYRDNA